MGGIPENGGNIAETPSATVENLGNSAETTPESTNNPTGETAEKMYSRLQVEQLMKRRVERSHNSFFKRYGVQDLKGLDDLFEQTKKFSQMQDEYGAIKLQNTELAQENAFLKNNIDPERYNDIKVYFKGSGIDFSEDELKNALVNHPEWLKQNVQHTTIKSLGSEAHIAPKQDESALASKIFGVKLN